MPSMDVGNSVTAAAVVPVTSADFLFCEATAAGILDVSFAARSSFLAPVALPPPSLIAVVPDVTGSILSCKALA